MHDTVTTYMLFTKFNYACEVRWVTKSVFPYSNGCLKTVAGRHVDSGWNVMARGDAREGKWRGNWRMEWVASTLHTSSEHSVSSITTADAHTWAASSRLNWRPRRFKWTRPFRRKTKSGFCACAITFQMASTFGCPRMARLPLVVLLWHTHFSISC